MMKSTITHQPVRRGALLIKNANLNVPSELTNLVIEEINGLPGFSPEIAYLKSEFLTKFVSDDTDSPEVRRSRAIAKWLSVERDNAATNDRLLTYDDGYQILPRQSWSKFVEISQSVIASIIGDTPPISSLYGDFSGGASTGRKRTESHPASKYLGRADITTAAKPWFELALEEMPGWGHYANDLQINEVKGNVLFTVPKTTSIDRCAAKEPELNMFLQKGVGNYIRRSLQKVGINLNDQNRNKRLAEAGSRDGHLATVDLSSASDSVSRGLVELMLPPCWFVMLDDLRSPITMIDDEEHDNEMFSSMGNGFTFELESLLFYAITRTVCYMTGARGVISVYGDDIICPAEVFTDLSWVLQCVGFSVNLTKSFHTGPFRESCGGHYHNGRDITPFYLRRPIKRLTDLIHVCNSMRAWSDRNAVSGILPDTLEDLWLFLKSFVPKQFWGGSDPASITQLCSPDISRSRLQATKREKKVDSKGTLLQWLNLSVKGIESPVDRLWDHDIQNFPRAWYGPMALPWTGVDWIPRTHIPILAFLENARHAHLFEGRGLITSDVSETVDFYRVRKVNTYCNRHSGSLFLSELDTESAH